MRRIRIAAFCLGVAALAAAGSYRASAADPIDLKPQVVKYWQAWQKGPDAAAPLYAKDAGLVFYDLEPLKYTGWNEYKSGVGPNILVKFDSIAFTVNDDVKTTARGNLAWTTATVRGDGALKGGSPVHVVMRHTAIWEKRGADWLIVHEHVSVPSSLPAPPQPKH
jgi:ketosteroid isomerase-like protein